MDQLPSDNRQGDGGEIIVVDQKVGPLPEVLLEDPNSADGGVVFLGLCPPASEPCRMRGYWGIRIVSGCQGDRLEAIHGSLDIIRVGMWSQRLEGAIDNK